MGVLRTFDYGGVTPPTGKVFNIFYASKRHSIESAGLRKNSAIDVKEQNEVENKKSKERQREKERKRENRKCNK